MIQKDSLIALDPTSFVFFPRKRNAFNSTVVYRDLTVETVFIQLSDHFLMSNSQPDGSIILQTHDSFYLLTFQVSYGKLWLNTFLLISLLANEMILRKAIQIF
jgi:hypothetical protein